jgi:hypothetical protein
VHDEVTCSQNDFTAYCHVDNVLEQPMVMSSMLDFIIFFLDKGRAIYLMSQPKENRLVLLRAARSSL